MGSKSRYRAGLSEVDQGALVFAGVGANICDPAQTLQDAVRRLGHENGLRVVAASPVYRSPPVGPQDQPHYLNAVLELRVTLAPRALLESFLGVEREFGRVRDIRWGPRTLDLDILTYDDRVIDEPGLTIPHSHMLERPFVLVPLADLRPNQNHPTDRRTYQDLAHVVGREGMDKLDLLLLPTNMR
jgi:2-amino-4-hydroxy-6-hydroxymethyldihydropteridine diphosphokinase